MEFIILTKADETEPHVENVQILADTSRDELGFLPASAYEEQCIKGRLWIAIETETGSIAGYHYLEEDIHTLKFFNSSSHVTLEAWGLEKK